MHNFATGHRIVDQAEQEFKGTLRSRLHTLLDGYTTDLRSCDGAVSTPVITPIASAFSEYRGAVSGEEWRDCIRELRAHPMLARLYEDPYSSHGFRKPRGYAGDAVLLDFIYGGGASSSLVKSASRLGAALYRECVGHPSFAAIRARRDHLSDCLAALCRSTVRPHVLSVACGHLREADSLDPAMRPGRFVALDQDPLTLEVAQSDHAALGLELVPASVLTLLRSGHELGGFDFIYSAGLYDYLSDDVAKRLTLKLAAMLNPGGRLLIANMLPELPAAAYMEAVMDWWLIYRTLRQVKTLGGGLGEAYSVEAYQRPCIAYMEIERGASQ